MSWKITLNPDHTYRLMQIVVAWLVYVAMALIAGYFVKITPRMDEFLFVLFIPLAVIIPYALFCLVAAVIRSLLPIRREPRGPVRLSGLDADKRLRD